jgi:hypothetical protein
VRIYLNIYAANRNGKEGIAPRRQERKANSFSSPNLAPFAPLRETHGFSDMCFIQNFKYLWKDF